MLTVSLSGVNSVENHYRLSINSQISLNGEIFISLEVVILVKVSPNSVNVVYTAQSITK